MAIDWMSAPEWTTKHGFFLQMGGFKIAFRVNEIVYGLSPAREESRYRSRLGGDMWEGVLEFGRFQWLLEEHKIDFPLTSETEIDDRSKGDALSKGFALLQITWFIIQLIARRVQGLTITELELTTAALAGLNSVMYVFWWNKPLDVRCPIVIRTKAVEKLLAVKLYKLELMIIETVLTDEGRGLPWEIETLLAEISKRPVVYHNWWFEDPRDFDLRVYIMREYVLLQLLG